MAASRFLLGADVKSMSMAKEHFIHSRRFTAVGELTK
jgi:hypothetical protein